MSLFFFGFALGSAAVLAAFICVHLGEAREEIEEVHKRDPVIPKKEDLPEVSRASQHSS